MKANENEKDSTTDVQTSEEFVTETENDGSQTFDNTDSTLSESATETASTKSVISMIYELTNKRGTKPQFEVIEEKGPAHMKKFQINCKVITPDVNLTTTGEGNSKKTAKKAAAEKMLIELNNLPAPAPVRLGRPHIPNGTHQHFGRMKRSVHHVALGINPNARRRTRNLIKEIIPIDASPDGSTIEDESTNPISRLIRIQQARKQREPTYVVMEERGQQRRKEFVIEVEAGGEKAQGVGRSKKQAKRVAAENLLIKLGHSKDEEISESQKLGAKSSAEKSRKVTFKEPEILKASTSQSTQNVGGSAGRQLVPGVLLMKNQDSKSEFCRSNIYLQLRLKFLFSL